MLTLSSADLASLDAVERSIYVAIVELLSRCTDSPIDPEASGFWLVADPTQAVGPGRYLMCKIAFSHPQCPPLRLHWGGGEGSVHVFADYELPAWSAFGGGSMTLHDHATESALADAVTRFVAAWSYGDVTVRVWSVRQRVCGYDIFYNSQRFAWAEPALCWPWGRRQFKDLRCGIE